MFDEEKRIRRQQKIIETAMPFDTLCRNIFSFPDLEQINQFGQIQTAKTKQYRITVEEV